MSRVKSVLLLLVFGLLLAACSQVAEVPKETPEETPQLESAASSPYTIVDWNKGDPVKNLISESQGFCYLAGIQGNFDSPNDQVSVFISQGKYGLYGGDAEWARAICVKWSALKTNSNAFQPVRWMSDEFSSTNNYCSDMLTKTWFGDAVTYLTGVGGSFVNSGFVGVNQSMIGDKPSELRATGTCVGGGGKSVYARGRSMFFGAPHVYDMPQFWGPYYQPGPYSILNSYSARTDYHSTVEMAPTDKAFCYLDGIGGVYNNSGDYAWIYRRVNSAGKEVWMLNVNNANSDNYNYVAAGASCYMLVQN